MPGVALEVGVTLLDGRVFAYGNSSQTAAIYDPTANSWTTAATPLVQSWDAAVVLLTNGTVLVTGGTYADGTVSDANVYDPVLNQWFAVSPMSLFRRWHCSTVLNDGTVLQSGGGTTLTEVFNPANSLHPPYSYALNGGAGWIVAIIGWHRERHGGFCGTL
jgi:hypothetical protein